MPFEKKEEDKLTNQPRALVCLLVDGTHCVEHHGEPTDCLQEVCFRSEQIQTQIDSRFPPVEICTCHGDRAPSLSLNYNTACRES